MSRAGIILRHFPRKSRIAEFCPPPDRGRVSHIQRKGISRRRVIAVNYRFTGQAQRFYRIVYISSGRYRCERGEIYLHAITKTNTIAAIRVRSRICNHGGSAKHNLIVDYVTMYGTFRAIQPARLAGFGQQIHRALSGDLDSGGRVKQPTAAAIQRIPDFRIYRNGAETQQEIAADRRIRIIWQISAACVTEYRGLYCSGHLICLELMNGFQTSGQYKICPDDLFICFRWIGMQRNIHGTAILCPRTGIPTDTIVNCSVFHTWSADLHIQSGRERTFTTQRHELGTHRAYGDVPSSAHFKSATIFPIPHIQGKRKETGIVEQIVQAAVCAKLNATVFTFKNPSVKYRITIHIRCHSLKLMTATLIKWTHNIIYGNCIHLNFKDFGGVVHLSYAQDNSALADHIVNPVSGCEAKGVILIIAHHVFRRIKNNFGAQTRAAVQLAKTYAGTGGGYK